MKSFLKNMSDRDVKILIYAVFAITTVFFASTLSLPYVLDEMTGCDYCGCRDICGFDQRMEGCEYRRLRKYTLEEALNSMKERLGILEEKGEAGE